MEQILFLISCPFDLELMSNLQVTDDQNTSILFIYQKFGLCFFWNWERLLNSCFQILLFFWGFFCLQILGFDSLILDFDSQTICK